jgi:nitroimidazol reductase NimA-like FMN-containing flavoprotein (pyridoxamine 5'-phosphate oxidase superfamily)
MDTLLRGQRIGHLGCSVNDRPYVVPISYVYDGSFVYGYTAPGRKLEIMREQPLVCFEVDEIKNDTFWHSVVTEAEFEELTGGWARDYAIAQLTNGGGGLVPRGLGERDGMVIFRLRLTERSGRFEQRDA